MLPINKALILVAVIAVVTFATRVLPFSHISGQQKNTAIRDVFGQCTALCCHGNVGDLLSEIGQCTVSTLRTAGADQCCSCHHRT